MEGSPAVNSLASPTVVSMDVSPQSSTVPCSTRAKNSFSLKIVKASMKHGPKPEFTPIEVGFIDITPKTANLSFIEESVKEKWGEAFVIVSNEGLPIVDCAGTRGELLVEKS